MLDKDQIHSPLYRNPAPNFNRLFSRRSSTIRLTLVTLFIGTIIWIMILKPLAESDTLTDFSDTAKIKKESTQPTWQIDLKKTIDERFSVYKREQFEEVALKKNRMIPVTAVLLNWKRMEALQTAVNYISKYPFIKEILVWNNNNETRIYSKVTVTLIILLESSNHLFIPFTPF